MQHGSEEHTTALYVEQMNAALKMQLMQEGYQPNELHVRGDLQQLKNAQGQPYVVRACFQSLPLDALYACRHVIALSLCTLLR